MNKSTIWRVGDLQNILTALESGRPDYIEAFDALRQALNIEIPTKNRVTVIEMPRRTITVDRRQQRLEVKR